MQRFLARISEQSPLTPVLVMIAMTLLIFAERDGGFLFFAAVAIFIVAALELTLILKRRS